MPEVVWSELEEHFRKWSGGFQPESIYEITVYIDYANPLSDEEMVRDYLLEWMLRDEFI